MEVVKKIHKNGVVLKREEIIASLTNKDNKDNKTKN